MHEYDLKIKEYDSSNQISVIVKPSKEGRPVQICGE